MICIAHMPVKTRRFCKSLLVLLLIISIIGCSSTNVYSPRQKGGPHLEPGSEYYVVFSSGFSEKSRISVVTEEGFYDTENHYHKFSEIQEIKSKAGGKRHTAAVVLGSIVLFLLVGSLAVRDTIESGFD